MLYNQFISVGYVPCEWLNVVIVPVFKKLVPWGTDGRLPLSDLDLDLGSGHTAYRRASLIDLYLRTKFH